MVLSVVRQRYDDDTASNGITPQPSIHIQAWDRDGDVLVAQTINYYAVPYTFSAVIHCTIRCHIQPVETNDDSAWRSARIDFKWSGLEHQTMWKLPKACHNAAFVCPLSARCLSIWFGITMCANSRLKQIDLQANDAFYKATWNGSCMRNRIRQFHPCWISNGAYACTWIGCVSTACDKSPFHSIDCLAPVGCLSHSDFCNCRVCVCAFNSIPKLAFIEYTKIVLLFSLVLYLPHILYVWRVRRQTNRRWYRNICIYTRIENAAKTNLKGRKSSMCIKIREEMKNYTKSKQQTEHIDMRHAHAYTTKTDEFQLINKHSSINL